MLSLLIAWSFFHRLYESGSMLSRNVLLIAPNIIVLDRLRADFDGLRIFFKDPVLPDNGHAGQNWLVFPTAKGRFFDWENFGMIEALRQSL